MVDKGQDLPNSITVGEIQEIRSDSTRLEGSQNHRKLMSDVSRYTAFECVHVNGSWGK